MLTQSETKHYKHCREKTDTFVIDSYIDFLKTLHSLMYLLRLEKYVVSVPDTGWHYNGTTL